MSCAKRKTRARHERWLRALTVVVVLGPLGCQAQSPAKTPKQPAQAHSVKSKQVPDSTQPAVQFYAPNFADNVAAFYDSEAFGAFMELLGKSEEDILSARSGARQLAPFLPESIACGVNNEGLALLDRWARVFFYMGLSYTSLEVRDIVSYQKLRDPLLDTLDAIAVPEIQLHTSFKTQQGVQRAMTLVSGLFRKYSEKLGQHRSLANEERWVLKLKNLLEPGEASSLLINMGVLPTDDPEFATTVEALAQRLELRLSVLRHERQLNLYLGPNREILPKMALVPEDPRLTSDSVRHLLWTHGDFRQIKQLASGWRELITEWSGSRAFSALKELDKEDMLGDMDSLADAFDKVPEEQTMLVTSDPQGLHWETQELGAPKALPLAQAGLPALIPKGTSYYSLDARTDMGEVLGEALSQVENRLASNWMKDAVKTGELDNQWDQIADIYYAAFDRFRQLLLREGQDVFQPPVGIIYDMDGTLTQATFRDPGKLHKFRNIPIPRWAILTKVSSQTEAKTRLAELYTEFAKAALNAKAQATANPTPPRANAIPPKADAKLRSFRLGSTKTQGYEFAGDWVAQLIGKKSSMSLGEGLEFHFFFVDDWLILSSARSLSRKVLDSVKTRPAPIFDANLLSVAEMNNTGLLEYVQRLEKFGKRNKFEDLEEILPKLTKVLGWFPRAKWSVVDTPHYRLQKGTLEVNMR